MEMLEIPKLVIGKGSIKFLKNLKGESALVVTDKIIQDLDFFNKILKNLKKTNMKIEVFDEVEPDPRDITVEKGVKIATELKPTWFIAIGGGSAMDTAKGIQFIYETGEKITRIDPIKSYQFKSRLIAIPTTSGTGSEVSYACVVTDSTQNDKKIACVNPKLTPYMAILDPKIPLNMPKSLTISTALDALVHGVESLFSNIANEFTRAMSIHAINLLFMNLPKTLEELENVELREKIHLAALMAGISMSGAGLGLCHGIGHSLGAVFHLPHGICVASSLPYVLEFSKDKIKDKSTIELLHFKAAIKDMDSLVAYIKQFFKSVGAPLTLQDLKIKKEDLEKYMKTLCEFTVTDTMAGLNPRQATKEEVEKILLYMFDGKSIDF